MRCANPTKPAIAYCLAIFQDSRCKIGFWPIHVDGIFCEKRRKRKRKEGGKKGGRKKRKGREEVHLCIAVATILLVELYQCLICFILLTLLWLQSYCHCFFRPSSQSSYKIITNWNIYCLRLQRLLEVYCCICHLLTSNVFCAF